MGGQSVGDELWKRDAVLDVLRARGVTVDVDGNVWTLTKGETSESHVDLPPELASRHLHRFANKFKIPTHLLFRGVVVLPTVAKSLRPATLKK
jgi:hypothetical protein